MSNNLEISESVVPEICEQIIVKNNDVNYPYTVFCQNDKTKFKHISPSQAHSLEIILNKTQYSREWIKLGDMLFKWRINPIYYQMNDDYHYMVSNAQFNWIEMELAKMTV
jgi:hypothetical protein